VSEREMKEIKLKFKHLIINYLDRKWGKFFTMAEEMEKLTSKLNIEAKGGKFWGCLKKN
jgi:hypothetical protein